MTTLISDLRLGVMAGLAFTRPHGCFAEVGVYQGGSAKVLYSVSQRQGRKLFLYDTFAGMPFKGKFDTHDVGMFADCSAEEVQLALPEAIIVKGVFPETVVAMPPVAFVHADADQYQTTVDIINVFSPLMAKGGMMLFDDYYCVPSCILAVDEYFKDENVLSNGSVITKRVLPDGRALVTFK